MGLRPRLCVGAGCRARRSRQKSGIIHARFGATTMTLGSSLRTGSSGMKRILTIACLTAVMMTAAAAQTYPSRPITMVVPFGAGGPTDALARILAQRMSQTLGQQVLIE